MSSPPDFIRKKFGPLRDKTLRNALAHRIVKEFPRIGGPRICRLCADMILEVVSKHMRSQEHLTHGKALWMAVSVNNPPRTANGSRTPSLSPCSSNSPPRRTCNSGSIAGPLPSDCCTKPLRLCQQAHQQGGLLSNCDLAELLSTSDTAIARVLARHERLTNTVVPRRATLHDVGTGLTHKRIICWKRYAEGKEPHLVARETYHSLEAVDRYLGQYDRVRHCRLEGLTPEQTAHALGCGLPLVREYLAIDDLLEKKRG